MSTPPLDELYFTWLYSQVGSVKTRDPARTYWKLLKQLYTKEFAWIVQNDDNRAEDGKELRRKFVEEEQLERVDLDWMRLGCSIFEMLVALADRFAFESDGHPHDCFWHLIQNLGLEIYPDSEIIPERDVDSILDRLIWRQYNRDGSGGLFPLKHTNEDQRQIELWYQLCAYILENE